MRSIITAMAVGRWLAWTVFLTESACLRASSFRWLVCAVMLGFSARGLAQETIVLENSSWQLVEIHATADSVFVPENPEDYLLRFRTEGRLQIEADCNQAGATYAVEGSSLALTDLVSTRKLCVAPSLFNRYLLNLIRAESVRMDGDRLVIQSDLETDWMLFESYVFVPAG